MCQQHVATFYIFITFCYLPCRIAQSCQVAAPLPHCCAIAAFAVSVLCLLLLLPPAACCRSCCVFFLYLSCNVQPHLAVSARDAGVCYLRCFSQNSGPSKVNFLQILMLLVLRWRKTPKFKNIDVRRALCHPLVVWSATHHGHRILSCFDWHSTGVQFGCRTGGKLGVAWK